MTIGISISTYRRSDGTSKNYLYRCLNSINEQIHKDFVVYIYGDKYDDEIEFNSIISEFSDKFTIKSKNLSKAVERERYPNGGLELWRCGGCNCTNTIIDDMISDGIKYVAHLDHDDYWSPLHLYFINQVIESENPAFIHTVSTYMQQLLPNISLSADSIVYRKLYPVPGNVIHSSTCIDFSRIPLRYRDTAYETGIPDAADADMWRRCTEYMTQNHLQSYLIEALTCFHDIENH